MPILCLHGIAQEANSPERLRKLWWDSLVDGFSNAGVFPKNYYLAVPFYGNILANLERVQPASGTGSTDGNYRGNGGANDIKAEVRLELAKRLGRRSTDVDDIKRGAKNTLLQLITSCLSSANEAKVIDAALDQVAQYLAQSEIRNQVLSQSLAALQECDAHRTNDDAALIVIAHSLGSVVAIDLLSEWTGTPIDLLVTVGSPLSIKGVHDRLLKHPPQWPGRVQTWVNFSDQSDVVALHGRIDRTNFFSDIYGRGQPCRCDVLNVLDMKNHMDNHHGIAGYLDDPVLATVVARVLDHAKSVP